MLVSAAEQMKGRGNEAEQFIFVAANKKVERAGVVRNLAIDEIAGQLFVTWHDQMKMFKLRPDGRMKKAVAVQALVIVRRNEAGENCDEVEKDQNQTAEHGDAMRFQPPPEKLPGRKRGFHFGDRDGRGGFHFLFKIKWHGRLARGLHQKHFAPETETHGRDARATTNLFH